MMIVLGYGLALLALGHETRTLNYHEARYALGAKEILASGHWLVPTVLGVPRVRKPPFTYWGIALSLSVFGLDHDWVVRAPSLVAALFVAFVLSSVAARWLGERIGFLTGLVQVSSVYVIVQAGLADPDMLLCAAVTGGLGAFAFAAAPSPTIGARHRSLAILFHAAIGFAFLIKGPVGAVFILLPAVVCARMLGPRPWRFFLDPLGLVLAMFLVVAWPAAVLSSHPSAFSEWATENVGRFRGELGSESSFFYLYTVPWLLLPWMPITAVGLWRSFVPRGERSPLVTLLAAWFLIGFAVLSLSAGKHERYAAPLLPPFAVFTAIGLVALGHRLPRHAIGVVLAVTWAVTAVVELVVVPRLPNRYRDQAECARRISPRLSPKEELFLFGIPNNRRIQVAYYLPGRLRVADAPGELPRGASVLTTEKALQRLADTRALQARETCPGPRSDALRWVRLDSFDPS